MGRKATLPRPEFFLFVNDQIIQRPGKILHATGRHDDPIPTASHVLGDPQKAAPVVFFEIEKEGLSLNLYFFRTQRPFPFTNLSWNS